MEAQEEPSRLRENNPLLNGDNYCRTWIDKLVANEKPADLGSD
jgi:hypothetical protein